MIRLATSVMSISVSAARIEIRLEHGRHGREDVDELLEELHAEEDENQPEAEIERGKQPPHGEENAFDDAFHA